MPDPTLQPEEARLPVELTYAPRRPRRRLGSTLRYWARDTFSRDSLAASLKALVWVVPLTLLIWIYAEREQISPMPNQQMTIELRGNDPGRVVKLISPPSGTIHADLRGPNSELEKVKEWLQSRTVPIDIPRDLPKGEHTLSIDGELNELQEVKLHGVTISNCMPAEITVKIDPLVTEEIEVVPGSAKGIGLNSAVFIPARVKLGLPESLRNDLRLHGQKLSAVADIGQARAATEPGKHSLSAVPLALSLNLDDPNVRLSPATVSAEVDIKPAEATVVLNGVRVLAAQPELPVAEQFKPVFDETLPTLTVSGPEDQIQALKDNKYVPGPAAIFEVSYSSTDPKVILEAPLIYQLPPGVHVSPDDAQRKIKYTLVRRTSTDQ